MAFLPLRPDDDADSTLNQMSEDIRDRAVADYVHAFIVMGADKSVIKKTDINKTVNSQQLSYKKVNAIIQAANKELNKNFGMRLYEPDKTKYILVNTNVESADLHLLTQEACEENTILLFILMEIFASTDEKVGESTIEENLEALELTNDELSSHLESLVKHMYLTVERQQDEKMYSWGPRAVAEVEPEAFFNRFLDLVGEGATAEDYPELIARIDKLKSIPNR